MNTLEDRLNNAAEEARQQVSRVHNRPAMSIGVRKRHHRTLASASAGAALFLVFGATAIVMAGGPGLDASSNPGTPSTVAVPIAPAETDTDGAPDTTTTSIWPATPVPPALRDTPLTKAWGSAVTETMQAEGFVPLDMDVFERGMDRGLVHATFTTADGNEWALAFGPWREGEELGDLADLQDRFFIDDPGQDTPDGVLFISGRTDPFYVYLAMDVGIVAVSLQPGVSGSAISQEQLGDLAISIAPTARGLIEADLIEWNT